MSVLPIKLIPIPTAIILFLFYGCGTNSYNSNYSYAPANGGKEDTTSTIYSSTTPSRLLSTRPDYSRSVKTVDVKPKKKAQKFKEIGPILNKISARNAINAYRLKHGLRPLWSDKKLDTVARSHSKDMATQDKISHTGSDGSDPWDRIERSGYKIEMATENLGTGVKEFNKLFTLWKASKVHNSNLLVPDATHMGIALVHNQNTKLKAFWTLVIAKKSNRKLITGSIKKAKPKGAVN